jgi:hypothetical protein
MKARIFFVVTSGLAGIAAMALFVFAASQAASAGGFFSFDYNEFTSEPRNGSTILARRLISIPFGIQDNLELSEDGSTVTVQGHGDCPDGGEDFIVRVTLSQDSINGLAVGRTTGECSGGEQVPWQVDVNAPGLEAFTEGDARACGHAVVHMHRQGDIVGDWCKVVTLE